MQQLLVAIRGTGGNDDGVICRKVAGPALQTDRKNCFVSLNCSSVFASRTITKAFPSVNDPNYNLQCRYRDTDLIWQDAFGQLRAAVVGANAAATYAINGAQDSLASAGKFAGTLDTASSSEMDRLFAVDAGGKLYKFEHLVTASSEGSSTASGCKLGRLALCLLKLGPGVSHDFSRAKLESGAWSGFKSVVVSELINDDLLVYGLKPNGDLMDRKIGLLTAGLNEPAAPASEIPTRVGNGWNNLSNVFSTGEGVVYGVAANGDLIWYHHLNDLSPNDPPQWDSHPVGNGWAQFTRLFSPGEGVIYAMRADGTLLWYKHAGYLNGDAGAWEGPKQVGNGWNSFKQVFAGQEGRIYAVNGDGDLLYYKNLGWRDGTASWTGPQKVASGWGDYAYAFSAMGGRAAGPVVR
jgi:hypothetical protein